VGRIDLLCEGLLVAQHLILNRCLLRFLADYEHACTKASGLGPVIGVAQCQAMALALPRCEQMQKDNCLDRFDLVGCQNAQAFCAQHISAPFWAAELNPCVCLQPDLVFAPFELTRSLPHSLGALGTICR
jgi:hypothetical protein